MKSYRLALALLTLLTSFSAAERASANPLGESVVAGSATFNRATPGNLIINQTSTRAIVNWNDFSIGAGELTKFIQPSATAAVLNRVVGGNPSLIYGSLQGNGQVYVINPSGILVGPQGQINTRAFLASTLEMRNADFLAGADLKLSGSSSAPINNQGSIEALGGDVFLIARTVENSGSIRAAGGVAGLAAGSEVLLKPAGNERLSVLAGNASAPRADNGVNNLGDIRATAVELKAAGGNIYALAINNGGIIRADSVVNENGRIVLRASGGNIQNSGTLAAHNGDGSGGSLIMDGGHNAESPATVINSGTLDAHGEGTGSKGGQVTLLGDHVGLFGKALVDVSGDVGGGTALIGGDYQGKNPDIQNAQATFVSRDTLISASALSGGNGGKVVVWADGATRFYGQIRARGGALGGNGGLVETSGKGYLEIIGAVVDASAPMGTRGSWLLDPYNVAIQNAPSFNGTFDGGSPNTFTPSGNTAIADRNTIEGSLNLGTSVIITTTGAGAQNGDITVTDTITKSAGGAASLTLNADGNIIVNAAISSSVGNLSLALNAPAGSVTITAPINTLGGDLSVAANGAILESGAGALTIGGTTTLAAGAANSITLNGANDFNTVAIASGKNVALTDVNSIDLGASTVSGTLKVTAGGTISQSGGALNVSGLSTFTLTAANSDVLLDTQPNLFTGVTVALSGAGTLRNLGLRDTSASANYPTLPAASPVNDLTLIFDNHGVTVPAITLTGNLSVTAGGPTTLSGAYSASTFNIVNGAVLTTDTTVGAGTITFGGTVNGGHHLVANSPGATTFGGVIGGTTPVMSVTTDAGGTVSLVGATTTGAQNYQDATVTLSGTYSASTFNVANMAILAGDTMVSAGTIGFGGTVDGAFNMAANSAGATSFGGAVGGAIPLTSLTTDSGGTAALVGATTTGAQNYQDGTVTLSGTYSASTFNVVNAAVLAADTTVGAGTIGFGGTLNGAHNLVANSPGATTFGGAVGGTTLLTSLTTDPGGTVSLVGAKTSGAQNYQDATATLSGTYAASTFNVANAAVLAADTTVGAGTIGFGGTVDGSHNLAANSAGATTFGGVVGGTTPLTSLTTDAGGTVSLIGATTTGAQHYQDATVTLNGTYSASTFNVPNAAVLAGDTTVGAGTISFGGTVDGAHNLAANSPGATSFSGLVGGTTPLASLTTDPGGTVSLVGATTTGAQTYQDATVTLSGTYLASVFNVANAAVLAADAMVGAGTIGFGGTVNGAHNLAANSPGATTFGGVVGGTTPLSSLTTDPGGTVSLVGARTSGAQNYQDPTATLSGTYAASVFNVANAAVLAGDTTVGAATISFGGTVDGPHNLAANSAGATTFGGVVGGATPLTSLTTDAGGTVSLIGAKTSGAQNYQDTTVTLSGTYSASTFNVVNAAVLAADTTVSAGTIGFAGTVNGAQNLVANSPGATTFGGVVGGTIPLTSLMTDGGGTASLIGATTTGAQNYQDATVTLSGTYSASIFNVANATVLAADTTVAAGTIGFAGTVDGGHRLVANSAGVTTFGGAVGGTTPLTSLTTDAGGTVSLLGATTTGAQNYQDATVTLSGTYAASTFSVPNAAVLAADTTVGAGTISFGGTVDGAHNLAANSAGATTFGGLVGSTTPLAGLTTDAGGTVSLLGATTTGAQNYQDATVTLSGTYAASTFNVANATVLAADTTVGAGTIGFAGTVNGAQNLVANSPGATTFGGVVGGTTPLASLTTDPGGTASLVGARTSGMQNYQDASVTLSGTYAASTFNVANATLLAGDTTVGAGTIGFGGTVDGAHNLTANSPGATSFGVVGGTTPLASLTTDAGGTASLVGATTIGAQTYQDSTVTLSSTYAASAFNVANAAVLAADTMVGAGTIGFGGTLDGAHNLTANSPGATTFGGVAGGTTPLTSLTTDAGGTASLVGATTTGAQNYLDATVTLSGAYSASTFDVANAAVLAADTTVSAGTIGFGGTVNGAHNLAANSSGATTFDGVVGGTTMLASLTTDPGGTVSLIGARTSGAQTYQDSTVTLSGMYAASAFNVANPAVLAADTTVGAGTIGFGATVDGAHNLAADSAVATTFGGVVGGATPLSSLTTDAGGTVSLIGAMTTGAQHYQDTTVTLSGTYSASTFNIPNAAVLAGDTTVGAGTIGFGGKVDGAFNLVANTPGATSFGGIVGGTTPLANLTADTGTLGVNANINVSSAVTINNSGAVTGPGTVTAGTLNLSGNGAVGTPGQRLNTAVGTIAFNKSAGDSYIAQSGNVNLHGIITGGGILDLKADSLTVDMPLAAATMILQPLDSTKNIDLGAAGSSGTPLVISEGSLNNITAGLLRIGSSTASGNITIRDNVVLGTLIGADLRTLSLKTAGDVSQVDGVKVEVAKLSIEARTVKLNPANPFCNNVNVLAAQFTGSFSYKDADNILTLADSLHQVDGIFWNPPLPLPPGASVSVTGDCGTIQIASLNQDLASISYVNIPIPRLSLSEIELGGNIDTGEVKSRFGNNSIITFYLEVPFAKKRFNLSRLKLEEQSKWVGGHLAIFGATSGPQGSQ